MHLPAYYPLTPIFDEMLHHRPQTIITHWLSELELPVITPTLARRKRFIETGDQSESGSEGEGEVEGVNAQYYRKRRVISKINYCNQIQKTPFAELIDLSEERMEPPESSTRRSPRKHNTTSVS